MKIQFTEKDPKKIVTSIMGELGERELGKMVNFNVSGGDLVVTISKLGTSTLTFTQNPTKDGLQYELTGEKIALTHRAFKDEITQKLLKTIERAGGKILSA